MSTATYSMNNMNGEWTNGTSSTLIVLDYDFEQDCTVNPVCIGFIDFIGFFEYDYNNLRINIETFLPTTCEQDGIFRRSFEEVIQIYLNGDLVGTLKKIDYSNGVIRIDTHELNFGCYDSINEFPSTIIGQF